MLLSFDREELSVMSLKELACCYDNTFWSYFISMSVCENANKHLRS